MSHKRPKHKVKPSLNKIPNSIELASTSKKPRIDPENSPISTKQKKPTWRMGLVDFEGCWGWGNINQLDVFKTIQDKLKNFESMTWGEIEKKLTPKGTPQNHLMSISNICKNAKDRLKQINLDDRDTLYSLRFSNTERLWGIREGEILYIIWWDHDHSIYPVPKK